MRPTSSLASLHAASTGLSPGSHFPPILCVSLFNFIYISSLLVIYFYHSIIYSYI